MGKKRELMGANFCSLWAAGYIQLGPWIGVIYDMKQDQSDLLCLAMGLICWQWWRWSWWAVGGVDGGVVCLGVDLCFGCLYMCWQVWRVYYYPLLMPIKYLGTFYCNTQWMHIREWIGAGKKSSNEYTKSNVIKAQYIFKISCLAFNKIELSNSRT